MSDLHAAIDEQRAMWPERPIREPESVVEHDRDEARTLRNLEDAGALSRDPGGPTRAEAEADEGAGGW